MQNGQQRTCDDIVRTIKYDNTRIYLCDVKPCETKNRPIYCSAKLIRQENKNFD